MPKNDNYFGAPAQPRPFTARALENLTSQGHPWRSGGWVGSMATAIRVGESVAETLDVRTFTRSQWHDGCGQWLEMDGSEIAYMPEDAGPTDTGRFAIRFSARWWDAAALAFLAPVDVRLVDCHGNPLMVVLDEAGEPRALLMPLRTTDADVKRAEETEQEEWPG